ncbi:hypothetical protein IAT38_002958 [Cryptococcus sp. DSM 104549]
MLLFVGSDHENGRQFHVYVPDDATTDDLVSAVSAHENLPAEDFLLQHLDTPLRPSATHRAATTSITTAASRTRTAPPPRLSTLSISHFSTVHFYLLSDLRARDLARRAAFAREAEERGRYVARYGTEKLRRRKRGVLEERRREREEKVPGYAKLRAEVGEVVADARVGEREKARRLAAEASVSSSRNDADTPSIVGWTEGWADNFTQRVTSPVPIPSDPTSPSTTSITSSAVAPTPSLARSQTTAPSKPRRKRPSRAAPTNGLLTSEPLTHRSKKRSRAATLVVPPAVEPPSIDERERVDSVRVGQGGGPAGPAAKPVLVRGHAHDAHEVKGWHPASPREETPSYEGSLGFLRGEQRRHTYPSRLPQHHSHHHQHPPPQAHSLPLPPAHSLPRAPRHDLPPTPEPSSAGSIIHPTRAGRSGSGSVSMSGRASVSVAGTGSAEVTPRSSPVHVCQNTCVYKPVEAGWEGGPWEPGAGARVGMLGAWSGGLPQEHQSKRGVMGSGFGMGFGGVARRGVEEGVRGRGSQGVRMFWR